MELREKAGSEDMLCVEKRLEREKSKEEHRLRQMAAAANRNVSVFDFINSKLSNQMDSTNGNSNFYTYRMYTLLIELYFQQ